ncbi:hypothetical protein WJX72_005899 [[Myrmecia] bisecta]|uniref:Uncharacterized protein n=1 Tax=[Myrmecia] bisecta TaxID=41462 RepID=A0AAW1QQT3_9CHLO
MCRCTSSLVNLRTFSAALPAHRVESSRLRKRARKEYVCRATAPFLEAGLPPDMPPELDMEDAELGVWEEVWRQDEGEERHDGPDNDFVSEEWVDSVEDSQHTQRANSWQPAPLQPASCSGLLDS